MFEILIFAKIRGHPSASPLLFDKLCPGIVLTFMIDIFTFIFIDIVFAAVL